jgi:thioesterase domain-containing protein
MQQWEQFSREPARIVDVPGDHYSLMSPKHVAAFQAILRGEIDRSFAALGR